MTVEDRLRAAVDARTETVEPSPDGWDRIVARIEQRERRWRRPAVVFPAVAAVLAAMVLTAALLTADRPKTEVLTEPPPTTVPVPTNAVTRVERQRGLWPLAGTSQSFEDPKALALSFATDFLGMPEPVVGELRDDREIDIRPKPQNALITTLEVAKDGVGAWRVVEARAASLQLDHPVRDAIANSPLALDGRSVAFEGTVHMAVVQAGQTLVGGESLGEGTFTGRGDEPSPFQLSVEFNAPTEPSGAVVLWTDSAEDGRVNEATVRRVRFFTIGGPVPETFVATTTDGRLKRINTADHQQTPFAQFSGIRALSLSHDGRTLAVETDGQHVHAGDIGTDLNVTVAGRAPSLSPEGSRVAVVREDSIVVQSLVRGLENVWSGGSGAPVSVAWASDGQALAFERAGAVYVFDTTAAQSLDDARRVATGSLPLFIGTNLAFVTSEGVMTIDGNGRERLLFDPGITVTNIDVDASGRHFLLVDDKHNLFWSGGGVIEPLATGIVDADW